MLLRELALNIPALRDEAKQLWGEHETQGILLRPGKTEMFGNLGWRRHLSNLIDSDDPELYLRENSK